MFAIRVNFFFNFQDFRAQRLIARINLNLQLTFLKRNSENAMVIAHSSFHLFFEIYTRKTKLHNEMGVEMLWKFEMKCSNGIWIFFIFLLYQPKRKRCLRVAQSWNDFISWKKERFHKKENKWKRYEPK